MRLHACPGHGRRCHGWECCCADLHRPYWRLKVTPIFAWYDLWVGVFIDRPKQRVYIFPVPMFGIVIEGRPAKEKR